jgi:hypothetical protein
VVAVQNLANNQVIILDFFTSFLIKKGIWYLSTEQLLFCSKGQLYCW